MKRLAYSAFVVFWATVGALWLVASLYEAADPPAAREEERLIAIEEIASHDTPESCWMVIDSIVYDFTDYLPEHPTRPEVLNRWCGREASEAYHTKALRRPRQHLPSTDAMLPQYRIGRLAEE